MTTHPARAPGLDLARALAIGAVVVCHALVIVPASPRYAALLTFLGGTGVSLFFALSGFLIGRIALRHVATMRDALRFWGRRWFRTLPAGLAVAALLAPALHPSALNFLATVTFTRGLVRDALHSPFLPHYWSLMVEEWFYLLLPLLLIAIGRSERRLAWLGAAWAALVLFRVVATWALGLTFYQQMNLTWMRLDAIMAGVVVAGATPLLSRDVGRVLCLAGWCGIAALFSVMLLADPAPVYDPLLLMAAPRNLGDWTHAAEASLVPALFAITLPAMAAWRPTRPDSAAWRLVQVAALLTYALYLVHWNVLRFVGGKAAGHLPPLMAYALAVVLSVLLAAVVHLCVERPFMALRDRVIPTDKAPPKHRAAQAAGERFARTRP